MRKYKFRYVFKHKKDGDCQYLFFTIEEIENGYAKEMIYAMKQDGYTLVDRNEFTGLKDKNGKQIYEGDVLINPKDIRGEIKYVPEYAAFLAYWKHDGECGYDYLDKGILMKCEVIGNIYENPELLKGDEDE